MMEAMSSQTNRMAMSWSVRWASFAVRHNHVIMLFYIGNKLDANGVLRGDWITESGSKSSKSKLFSIRFVMIGRRYSSISCAFPRVSNSMRLTNLHLRLSKRDGEWIHQKRTVWANSEADSVLHRPLVHERHSIPSIWWILDLNLERIRNERNSSQCLKTYWAPGLQKTVRCIVKQF